MGGVVFSCGSNSALVVPVRHALYAMLSLLKYNKSQSYSSTPTVRLSVNLTDGDRGQWTLDNRGRWTEIETDKKS